MRDFVKQHGHKWFEIGKQLERADRLCQLRWEIVAYKDTGLHNTGEKRVQAPIQCTEYIGTVAIKHAY